MEILIDVFKLLLSFLWFGIVLFILIKFYKPIRYDLLQKLAGFKALGIEFSFIKNSIDAALELADKNPKWKVEVPESARNNVLNRAREHLDVFRNSSILWIDDNPENNLNEWRMFLQLNVKIELAKSTDQALDILHQKKYDVVISDMVRNNEDEAGLQFLNTFRKMDDTTPVIFYIGTYDPKIGVPFGAFGITNRPDELLHLVLDALEREKY